MKKTTASPIETELPTLASVRTTASYFSMLTPSYEKPEDSLGVSSTDLGPDADKYKEAFKALYSSLVKNKTQANRVYPHIYDEYGPYQDSLKQIENAIKAIEMASSRYSHGDLSLISNKLSEAASYCKSAYKSAGFNSSFSSIVLFVKRAVLTAEVSEVSLDSLSCLEQTLRTLHQNPMLSLGDAAELSENLSEYQWRGESDVVDELLSILHSALGHPPLAVASDSVEPQSRLTGVSV